MDKVAAHNFVGRVLQKTLQVCLAGLLHRGTDFGKASILGRLQRSSQQPKQSESERGTPCRPSACPLLLGKREQRPLVARGRAWDDVLERQHGHLFQSFLLGPSNGFCVAV